MLKKEYLIEHVRKGTPLTEIVREIAAQVITEALAIEADMFIEDRQELMDNGKRRLVLHGTQNERDILFPFGVVPVKTPRITDRKAEGEPIAFASRMVPRYLKRSNDLAEFIPWMYLKGISESDFQSVFEALHGQKVKGLSSSTINRMMDCWVKEFSSWESRDMSKERYAYVWADGIYSKVRGEKENVCQLVLLGVGEDGRKALVGMGEGYAESSENWRELLVKLRSQGMEAPRLVIGDGGLGLWSGLRKVFPDCARQYCWVHKLRDVVRHLPKSRHFEATRQVRDIYMSESKFEAGRKIATMGKSLGVKHPKAAETLTKWTDELLGFYDFPAEHWRNLRSTNAIESLFSTIRLRTGKTKGRLSRSRLGALLFKLAQTASEKMRAISHHEKVKLVLDGTLFMDGEEIM
ncbi:MAG: IS256 family transposase [Deltaproteobacteria bacterium]|jgi:transposase-like protein|nr:IS256 family transposase [Deltaproteobacteria bacterium]